MGNLPETRDLRMKMLLPLLLTDAAEWAEWASAATASSRDCPSRQTLPPSMLIAGPNLVKTICIVVPVDDDV